MFVNEKINMQRLGNLMSRSIKACCRCYHVHLVKNNVNYYGCPRLMGSSVSVRQASNEGDQSKVEDLTSNPYFEKYADKIKELQKSEPQMFKNRIEELGKPERLPEAGPMPELPEIDIDRDGLDAVMNISLLEDKSSEEIEEIWKTFHKNKEFVYAVIPSNQYDLIREKSRLFPTFLLPVPRGEGYEYFVSQFRGHEVHFTPLLVYQMHGENAPVAGTLTFYPELSDTKGIVLMRGTSNKDILDTHSLGVLAQQIEQYYGLHSGDKFNLVRIFNQTPKHFNHEDLVKELKIMAGAR